MRIISNNTKSGGGSGSSSEDYVIEPVIDFRKEQVKRANAVPMLSIFRFYGMKSIDASQKLNCPFAEFHKNGFDHTPSFCIYTNTNSFYCWGCKIGGGPVDFVSEMENINKIMAANKILSLLGSEADPSSFEGIVIDPFERLSVLMDFSDYIRHFVTINYESKEEMRFMDEICLTFDTLNEKYKNRIPNSTLRVIVDRLKGKVEDHIK